MPVKKWVPTDYVDEVAPAPRNTPSDWLIRLPDGRIAIDANDSIPNTQPRPLEDGAIVLMSWVEYHGTGFVTLDAVDKSIIALPDMPPSPPGGTMMVIGGDGGPEAVAWDLASLTSEWDAGDSETVTYYAWSDHGTPYILVGDKLEPVEPTTVARCGILAEIVVERGRQDAKWGGHAHDDTHDDWVWGKIIHNHTARLRRPTQGYTPENYRQILVEIGALAVAAIESYDRRHAAQAEPSALDSLTGAIACDSGVDIAEAAAIAASFMADADDTQPGESGEATDQAALDAWTRSGWSDLAKAEG